ncbi:hypothetical protein [Actinoplanes sp. NPDC049599]|uniref:hypothetical protein n=1 Tax=Actinoplanes sp. NPDC049599 TaxID=3363903 RepID=UPI003794713E
MGSLVGAIIAAVAGLAGVTAGALLNARRERGHWLRDQKLKAGTDFITAARYLINQYRRVGEQGMDQTHRREVRDRMQSARSALVLLCAAETVAATAKVSARLYETTPGEPPAGADETEAVFAELVDRLRAEVAGQPRRGR